MAASFHSVSLVLVAKPLLERKLNWIKFKLCVTVLNHYKIFSPVYGLNDS